jgi:hypothetical protein
MGLINSQGLFDGSYSPFLVRELDPWTQNVHFQYQQPDGSITPNANIWTQLLNGQMQYTDQGNPVPAPQGYVPPSPEQLSAFGGSSDLAQALTAPPSAFVAPSTAGGRTSFMGPGGAQPARRNGADRLQEVLGFLQSQRMLGVPA